MRNKFMKNSHGKNNHTKNNHRENRMSLGALCLSLLLVLGACGQAEDAAADRGAQTVAEQSQTTETANIREASPKNEHNGHSVVIPEDGEANTTEPSDQKEAGEGRVVEGETPEASGTDSADAGLTEVPQPSGAPGTNEKPGSIEMSGMTGSPGPTETTGPSETPGPTETMDPAENPSPTATPRPTVTPGPTGSPRPTATPRPSELPGPGASEPVSSPPPEGGAQEPEQGKETPSAGTSAETGESHCLTEADHEYRKIYWYGTASCGTETNFYNLECIKCGHVGGSGTDIIPHTPVETVTTEKDCCIRNEITESVCGVCGMYLGRNVRKIGEEHSWVTGEGPVVWNEQTHSFEHKTVVYCSICLQEQDAANP